MTEDIAVGALVRNHTLLLAHRHPARRWYPDCWDLIGGHIESGETPREALQRECREEIAVDVLDLRPVEVEISDPNLRTYAFVVSGWTGEPVNAAPLEHDALGWSQSTQIAGLHLAHTSYATRLPRLIEHHQAAGPQ